MEQRLRGILEDNFQVPPSLDVAEDLREYIVDSIDVGELIAICNAELDQSLSLADFKEVYTLNDLIEVLKQNET